MDLNTVFAEMNRAVCQRAATLDPAHKTYKSERAEGGFYRLSVSLNDGGATWSLDRSPVGVIGRRGLIKWDTPGAERPLCHNGEWTDTDLEVLERMLRYIYPASSRGRDL